jgi:HlyD family secretion protein
VKIGQEVKVSVDAGDGSMKELTGKITWISPKAEFTPKVGANQRGARQAW